MKTREEEEEDNNDFSAVINRSDESTDIQD